MKFNQSLITLCQSTRVSSWIGGLSCSVSKIQPCLYWEYIIVHCHVMFSSCWKCLDNPDLPHVWHALLGWNDAPCFKLVVPIHLCLSTEWRTWYNVLGHFLTFFAVPWSINWCELSVYGTSFDFNLAWFKLVGSVEKHLEACMTIFACFVNMCI